ncbi:type II secretion system protein GspE [candidate division KSB1 bacterium]|nr:type II secretion system protein GspE [candidate division KSB1 bacterium]
MKLFTEKMSRYLIKENIITTEQWEDAINIHRQTGEKLQDVLIKNIQINEEDLLRAQSKILGIPRAHLDASLVDQSIIDAIPLSMARKYRIVPIAKVNKELTVAMSNPLDVHAIDVIQYHTKCKLLVSLASENEIDQAIDKCYSLRDSMDQVVAGIHKERSGQEISDEEIEEKDISEISISEDSDESSVINLVNLIILQSIKDQASDIHFEPDEKEFRVRNRIDGILNEFFCPPKSLQANIISRIKILADMDVSERRIPQDGRFSLKYGKKEIDIRASILPTVEGEKAVLRILDKSNTILSLEDMGFADEDLERWLDVLNKTEGIILITGPTGSGKTTTLYAVLNRLNSKDKNIVTVENPVEYKLNLINQVNVNPKAGLTFANGLRSILRQDPDIIMIGEIRDSETADIAIRSALTGHLVLSTLHTNDAPSAIARLIDMGLEPFLVESSLIAVLAQRLVRKLCPKCAVKIKLDEKIIDRLNVPDWLQLDEVYRGEGCAECNYSGYQRRTAIHELLIIDDAIRKLIISGAPTDEIRTVAKTKGMKTLKENGLLKVSKRLTTVEEVLRVAF